MASRTASAPWPASAGPFFMRGRVAVARHARQVQQHREPRRALHQRADRRAAQSQDEIPLPVARHRPVGRLRRTLADHDLGRDEGLAASAGARPRHPQRPPGAQAGGQLAAQRAAALHEQRLVDGLVADAHRLIVREVERQAPGDLLRAPGPGPSPILPPSMPTALPGHGRAGNGERRSERRPCRPVGPAHRPQCRVGRKLRRLRATSGSLGMPLRRRRTILQAAASRGGIAPQLPRDRRGRPPEPAGDLPHGMALRAKKRDLLPLREREIPPGERLRRRSEHRWWHAACLPEPSCPYRRATHPPRRAASSLAMPAAIAAQNRRRSSRPRHRRSTRSTQWRLAQTDPSAAFECSSQPPSSRCCDDRFESALRAAIAVMDEAAALDGSAIVQSLLQRVQHEAGVSRALTPASRRCAGHRRR